MPPILEGHKGPWYASLACSHINLSLRCVKNGTQSPVCNLKGLMDDETLTDVVVNGHSWWVLPESIGSDMQQDISLWKNQDQNENQQIHEIEVLQTLRNAAEGFLKLGKEQILAQDIIAAAQRRHPVKVADHLWKTLAKWYISILEDKAVDLISDLADFHSQRVDPRELTVSASFFFKILQEPALKKCPLLRHYLITSQYSKDKVMTQSTGPALGILLEHDLIESFCKKGDVVTQTQKTIETLRAKYLPILQEVFDLRVARLEMTVYIDLILRALFGKPWPLNMVPPVSMAVGNPGLTEAKILNLGIHWAQVVEATHPGTSFAKLAGLEPASTEPEDPDDSQVVDLGSLRELKASGSDAPEPKAPAGFKRGDAVTVVKKMTWHLPHKANPDYRKDINEGSQGVIEGYADPAMTKVLLKMNLKMPDGKRQDQVQPVNPRNLMLTSEYNSSKVADPGKAPAAGKAKHDEDEAKGISKWILGSSAPADVHVEAKWTSLVADQDELCKLMALKGRIYTSLQVMSEVLPRWTLKDFVVAHRRSDKGVWKGEVWTKRDFEAYEILLAPFSSQIKDTHLTAGSHAGVTLPLNGRGAHPQSLSLALDGRLRNLMAQEGAIDEKEHEGYNII